MTTVRLIFIGTLIALFGGLSSAAVAASVPPEVMSAYQSYNAALESQDNKLALKHAKTAWSKAEDLIGENKLTGDLAYNYGYLAMILGKFDVAAPALERTVSLAHLSGEGAALIRLEREEMLISVLIVTSKRKEALARAKQAREFAQAHNLDDSLFAGEIMVHQARLISTNANQTAKRGRGGVLGTRINGAETMSARIQSRSSDYAEDAIAIFDKNPKTTRQAYKAIAYKLVGFSHERDKEWLEAALAYQTSMQLQKTGGLESSGYATTLGRWINARNYLKRGDGLEAAKEQGLCACWPYDNEEDIQANPIKRQAPIMPQKALRGGISGFSIMKFDLDKEGRVVNPEIIHSWPEKLYERSSMVAIKKWKYETEADGVKGAQRKGIVTTIHYFLQDWKGDPI